MKKIIGIYDCNFNKKAYDTNPECLGGSETWTSELVKRFVADGNYYVILFCVTDSIEMSNNLEYVPCGNCNYRCSYTKFDLFISSRTITGIADNLVADKVYVMVHDQTLIDYKYKMVSLRLDKVDKYCFVSDYQKRNFQEFYKGCNQTLPDSKCVVIGNGINASLYEDIDESRKKNQMVFSSRPERGLLLFLKKVFPIVRRSVPDFTVKVCHYGDNDSRYDEARKYVGVEVVGKLGKSALANLQKESKVWIYLYDDDNYRNFRETFCITAIENGNARNAIFTINEAAIPEVLKGYDNFYGINDYEKIAADVVKCLKNEKERKRLSDKAFEISSQYSWDEVWKKWVEEVGF